MNNPLLRFIFTYIILFRLFPAFSADDLKQRLVEDINDRSLDSFSLQEAAFILSGADQSQGLNRALAWYDSLVETINDFHLDSFDRIGTASKIFSYLHSTWLITYREKATTLLDVINKKEYNCVASTILYNLVCSDLGLSTAAFETPTHVYTIFTDFSQRVMVENTSPMGFDIMQNLHAYSRYLAQFYPKEKMYKIGLDRLYAYENSKGREINNTELLGLLAYNRAYFAQQQQDYQSAYDFVRLAQAFNQDSRSNIDFEIDLYYRWGRKLFEQRNFMEAFKVNADAAERYPFNRDFAHNCEIAFANALIQSWQNKDWNKTTYLVDGIIPMNILSDKSWELLKKILMNWSKYFVMIGDNGANKQAIKLLQDYFETN